MFSHHSASGGGKRETAQMTLTIDLGNSTLSWVLFADRTPVLRDSAITTRPLKETIFTKLMGTSFAERLSHIFIASVVPDLDDHLRDMCRHFLGRSPLFLDHRIASDLRYAIDDPTELGADRIAACLGALEISQPPLIVIDSGTATTFDLIDEEKCYQGGAIAPGLELLHKSLFQNTAKLKAVQFDLPPVTPVGKNTRDHIRIGAYNLFIGGLERLIAEYRQIMGDGVTVIASGGTFRKLTQLPRGIDRYEMDLVHIGLRGMGASRS